MFLIRFILFRKIELKGHIFHHIKNIFKEEELTYDATVAKNATVQIEGNRDLTLCLGFAIREPLTGKLDFF